MTENRSTHPVPESAADLRLIRDYMTGRLDPERSAAVTERLDRDPAFLEFAWPIMLGFKVAREEPLEPIEPGELEKNWDAFTKMAGFVHQKKKARRRRLWMLGIALLVIGAGAFAGRREIAERYRDLTLYESIAWEPDWITLRDGSEVLLSRGAQLRAARQLVDSGTMMLKLRGEARFRVVPPEPKDLAMPPMQPVRIATRAGEIGTVGGEFLVHASGDTTAVELFVPAKRMYMGRIIAIPTMLMLFHEGNARQTVVVRERERAMLVRGDVPRKLPVQP